MSVEAEPIPCEDCAGAGTVEDHGLRRIVDVACGGCRGRGWRTECASCDRPAVRVADDGPICGDCETEEGAA
jgi:DnaJ-class molecular chaperone